MTGRSSARSQVSEASISALSEPGCGSSPSASPTPTVEASSPSTGPTSRAMGTFDWSEYGNDRTILEGEQPPLKVSQARLPPLMFSVEASRAKTGVSLDADEESKGSDQACSLSLPGSPMSLFDLEDGCCLRTSPGFSLPAHVRDAQSAKRFLSTIAEPTSSWCSPSSPTSGFTTSRGECWTAVTSECPSGGDASTSLQDVLLDEAPERFSLSPRAAAGILRRAQKRGRVLPQALRLALMEVASLHRDDDSTTTRTSSGHCSQATLADGAQTTMRPQVASTSQALSGAPKAVQTTTGDKPIISSPTPSGPRDSTPAKTVLDEARRSLQAPSAPICDPAATPVPRSSVRRLTPTECERLQGFPDGWTIPGRTVPDMQRWATPSPSPFLTGSGGA